ncbi:MOSC domain-containing protein [Rhizobium grahamii]|uniref:MOSC domain containing protein n=1 Tax=Rhizobium grahamii CCGE 502 TaxID=990285 RepID=S3HFV7_9HYPH|nr:MOSC N-terminal beta barrel domain-containing protein [Rhizobium grahamii]EPE96955.1 MOSC domain containing protein [Rhizobium grahamii CCGE 502]
MRKVGTISELWRYPVSSTSGEKLEQCEVTANGVVGDRRFALVDAATGGVAYPERDKRWQRAIFVKSRIVSDGDVEVQVPGHDWWSVDAPRLTEALTAFFEFEVSVRPYERAGSTSADIVFANNRYEVSPLHLLTSASVDHLKAIHPDGDPDRRRFRPNVYLETDADLSGFAELQWIDAHVRLGDIPATVIAPTKRCGFTIIAQDGLENDPEILRNVMKFGNRNMGVYCRPDEPGFISVGEPVFV